MSQTTSLAVCFIFSVASGGLGSQQQHPLIMAKALLALYLLIYLCFESGDLVKMVNAQKTWCVAKPSSDEATLLANINYACSQVDCQILQKDCFCFYPDNMINHASVAMNLYYRAKGRNWWNCNFKNSGLIVVTDPSYGDCKYE